MQGGKIVKVKLGQLDRASIILRELVKEKLPFKASYWLRRNIDVVAKVYQPFIEAKQGLFKEFAEKDEAGNIILNEDKTSVKLIEDETQEFWKQYSELAGKDVEMEVYPLELEWFNKLEATVEELAAIDFVLEGYEDA